MTVLWPARVMRVASPVVGAHEKETAMPAIGIAPVDRPLSMVDVVAVALLDGDLKVLLVPRQRLRLGEPHPNRWSLPGGGVDIRHDESFDASAARRLAEQTGLSGDVLEQVGTWGGPRRDPRGWSVTTVYLALVPTEQARAVAARCAGPLGSGAQWHPTDRARRPGPLAFDHDQLLEAALGHLLERAEHSVLPAALLPATFTLPEMQRCFEAVLGRGLEKSAFRARMLSAGAVCGTGEYDTDSRRPAMRYRMAVPAGTRLPGSLRRGADGTTSVARALPPGSDLAPAAVPSPRGAADRSLPAL